MINFGILNFIFIFNLEKYFFNKYSLIQISKIVNMINTNIAINETIIYVAQMSFAEGNILWLYGSNLIFLKTIYKNTQK